MALGDRPRSTQSINKIEKDAKHSPNENPEQGQPEQMSEKGERASGYHRDRDSES